MVVILFGGSVAILKASTVEAFGKNWGKKPVLKGICVDLVWLEIQGHARQLINFEVGLCVRYRGHNSIYNFVKQD